MTPQDFCYWLNGYFDLSDGQTLSPRQVEVIKGHLSLVFDKQKPSLKDLIEKELTPESVLDKMPLPWRNPHKRVFPEYDFPRVFPEYDFPQFPSTYPYHKPEIIC